MAVRWQSDGGQIGAERFLPNEDICLECLTHGVICPEYLDHSLPHKVRALLLVLEL